MLSDHSELPLLISHELGHTIGMDDSGEPGSLMYEKWGSGFNEHIRGCEYRDGSVVPVLPRNCVPVAGEGAMSTGFASCEEARFGAAAIVGTIPAAAAAPAPLEGLADGGLAWSASNGLLSLNTGLFTAGAASVSADGDLYRTVTSPQFRTADWPELSDTLSVDVYVSPAQPNPYWLGALGLIISVPSAGINNLYVAQQELLNLPLGEWTQVDFGLPPEVVAAFEGDYADGSISFSVNTPWGAPSLLLDNLRFTGDVEPRSSGHQEAEPGGETFSVFSFDTISDWSVSTGDQWEEPSYIEGSGALGFSAIGYTVIQSRWFETDELPTVTGELSVDLLTPEDTPNPYWLGAMQLVLSCPDAGVYDAFVGQNELFGSFPLEYNTYSFPLGPAMRAALETPGVSCSAKVVVNVAAEDSRPYALDNMAFR